MSSPFDHSGHHQAATLCGSDQHLHSVHIQKLGQAHEIHYHIGGAAIDPNVLYHGASNHETSLYGNNFLGPSNHGISFDQPSK